MQIELSEPQRKALKRLVKQELIKANNYKDPGYSFDNYAGGYRKPRSKYGIKAIERLYELENLLK